MARQSKAQQKTVSRTMHTYKKGALTSGSGRTVKNPKQAIAIGLSEAGASRTQGKGAGRSAAASKDSATPKRRGRPPGGQSKAGAAAKTAVKKTATQSKRTGKSPTARRAPRNGDYSGWTRLELYQQASKKDIPGRSRMSKAELIQHLS